MKATPLHEHGDRATIAEALLLQIPNIWDALRAKGIEPDAQATWRAMLNDAYMGHGKFRTAVLGPYLLVYDVVDSWFSRGRYLQEIFLFRWTPGSFGTLVQDLEDLGQEHNCDYIVIGSAAQAGEAYPRLLRRHGFTETSREFMKGINYG